MFTNATCRHSPRSTRCSWRSAKVLTLMGQKLGAQALLSVPLLLDSDDPFATPRRPATVFGPAGAARGRCSGVRRHLDQVALAYHAAIFETLRACGQNQTVTWADIYAPGKVEMLQCDFCVNISPAMFDEFVLPSLKLWSEYFDENCYHLDGAEQYRFIDRFCGLTVRGSARSNGNRATCIASR